MNVSYCVATYDQLKASIAKDQKQLDLYDALIAQGLPKTKVHYFSVPMIKSGYIMGERVVVRVNSATVTQADYTKEYARSCKYRAKHGKVVLDFSKKDLRYWLDWCVLIHTSHFKEAENINIDKFLQERVNKAESILKNGRIY